MLRPCKLVVLTWSLLTAAVVTAAGLGLRGHLADANQPVWPELSALDEVPEEDFSAADRRGDAKHEVALELVAGHLTLLEAAARFRTINAGHPHGEKFSHCSFPGGTYEEWLCRQVISYVHSEFLIRRKAPAQAAAWEARLEAELRECLRRDGKLCLPHPGNEGGSRQARRGPPQQPTDERGTKPDKGPRSPNR
jgi:hypothetical protein